MRKTKKLLALTLAVVISVSTLGMTASADEYYGDIAYGAATTTASLLNIREGCGTDTSILGTIPYGTRIVVLECTESGWYKINYNGTVGYCSTDYLTDVLTAENFSATGMFTGNDVCVRSIPSTDGDVLDYYYSGTQVSIIGINNVWYKIQDGGLTGYVRSDLMAVEGSGSGSAAAAPSESEEETSSGSEDVAASGRGMVTADEVRLRAEPNTNCAVLNYYWYGAEVDVLATNNDWYKVQDGSLVGYIRNDLMTVLDDDYDDSDSSESGTTEIPSATGGTELGRQIADYALQFVGYDYVYGGASPSEGFDCSGFVMYIYEQFGYYMPHGATSQYRTTGYVVSKSDLQAGDLVFFSADESGITHVGMYIGGGDFVHAANSNSGVVISSLNSDYYTAVYYSAKRIV